MLDKHAPLKKLSKREVALKQKPWIIKKIQRKMIELKKTIQKFEIHEKYKIIRNSIVFEINKSKRQYFEIFFANSSNDIKKIWSSIRSLVTLKSTSSSSVSSLTINQKTISDPLTIANSFNEFFTTEGSSLAKKIPKSKKSFFRYLGNKIQNSFSLKPVQEEEIKKIVMKLNSNKSVGPNSLPIKILQSHIDSLAKALATIINISFKEGQFPTALLLAKVKPVFKKDDPQLCSNYRPISVLFLAKFMKSVCILDYILFLKNIIYYLINNLDFVLGIQQIMS